MKNIILIFAFAFSFWGSAFAANPDGLSIFGKWTVATVQVESLSTEVATGMLSNIFSEGKRVVFGTDGMLYESTADTLLNKLCKHTFYFEPALNEIIVKNGYLLERYRMVLQTNDRIELVTEDGDKLVLTR